MAKPTRQGDGRSGRSARLSRDRVLQAALALADADGIEALTMRNLARTVDAEAMSLYRHVRDKDDILDGIVDLVYAEIPLPGPETPWLAAMRERAVATRAVLLRHRWAVGLMESRRLPGPANLRHHDAVVGILTGAGFDARSATHAYNLIDSYIYGFVLQERNLPFKNAAELQEIGPMMLRQIPADVYPHLRKVAEELLATRFDYGKEFEYGLDLILDALARPVR